MTVHRLVRLHRFSSASAAMLVIAVVAMLAPSTGCTARTGDGLHNLGPIGAATGHAIHVYAVESGGSKTPLAFGPGTEVAGPTPKPLDLLGSIRSGTYGKLGSELTTKDLPSASTSLRLLSGGFGDGGSPVTFPPTIGNPQSIFGILSTAWALVWRATQQCGITGVGHEAAYPLPYPWGLIPDGNGISWYMTPFTGESCSYRLALEENMLCVADKLAEIGDSVGTVVWPALNEGATPDCLANDAGPFLYGSGPVPATLSTCAPILWQEWDIPPQADADRFVARDLAIHTLGILELTDSMNLTGCSTGGDSGVTACSCAKMFGSVASGAMPVTTDGASGVVFGVQLGSVPGYPPSTLPVASNLDSSGNFVSGTSTSNAPTIATTALEVEGQILRAGGRLLHDLVRRNVYSDMAAAAAHAAQTLDPVAGSQAAWGVGPGGFWISPNGEYATYAHAARTILGRWEIGDGLPAFSYHGDPAWYGGTALYVLPFAYGPDLSARVNDRSVRTNGEALAARLVEQSGIVIPTCGIETAAGGSDAGTTVADGGESPLRTALVDQLVTNFQLANGIPVNLGGSQRAIFENTARQASDAEIAFGFERAFRTYRLLTNTFDSIEFSPPPACAPVNLSNYGLVAVANTASSVSTLQGVAIQGGISRSRLRTDPIARAGGMLEYSQGIDNFGGSFNSTLVNGFITFNQFLPGGQWTEWGTTSVDPLSFETGQGKSITLPEGVFQDAFHMGQAFERRLVLLGAQSPPASATGDPQSIANGAVAELRSWAGSTIVHAWGVTTPSTGVAVRVAGFDYAKLGLNAQMDNTTRDNAVKAAFGFVYGAPWVAECAVHARNDCPAGFDSSYVQHPSAVQDNQELMPPVDYTGLYGATGPVFQLTVPFSGPANFNPAYPTPAGPQIQHLYMVLLRDLSNPTGQGQVLGTIPINLTIGGESFGAISSFVVAPMQSELLGALNTGHWMGAAPPRIGELSGTDTSGYCVDGVPRDVFVPLQNELTSTTGTSFEDSWQHYLDIAQQAATTADTLGQQLINLNLQISEREEAAGEQLANLCGDVGALSQVTTSGTGVVTPSASDSTLQSCLAEPTTDVVFLGPLPDTIKSMSPSQVTAWLTTSGSGNPNILNCPTSNDPMCTVAKQRSLTVGSLDLSFKTGSLSSPRGDACSQMSSIAASRMSKFQATDFRRALGAPYFATDSMQSLVASLKMTVNPWDHWTVTYVDTPIMDSESTSLWPGCLSGHTCDTAGQAFNTAFRYCPNATDANSLYMPGLGCDASGSNAAAAELNMLKWRVAGAMWMLASAAGYMPPGMFTLPVPVVTDINPSFAAPQFYQGHTTALTGVFANRESPQLQEYALQAGYNGQYGLTSQPLRYTTSSADANTVNPMYAIPTNWTAFTNNAGQEMTAAYLYAYGQNATSGSPQTYHTMVGSSGVNWPNCMTKKALGIGSSNDDCSIAQSLIAEDYPGGYPSGYGLPTGLNLTFLPQAISFAQLLDAGAYSLDGLSCGKPWGEPSGGAPKAGPSGLNIAAIVNMAKTGFDPTTNLITNPGTAIDPFHSSHDNGCFVAEGVAVPEVLISTSCNDYDITGVGTCAQPGNTSARCASSITSAQGLTSPGWAGAVSLGPAGSTAPLLSPTQLTPWQRAINFTNMAGVNGSCNAISLLVGAASLACGSTPNVTFTAGSTPAPPQINSVSDIAALQSWLALTGTVVGLSVQHLYVEGIPTRVISDFTSGQVGTGSKSGQHGADVLDIEEALTSVSSSWTRISSDLNQVSLAIQAAELALNAANLKENTTAQTLALQQIQVQGQMAQASTSFLGTITQALGGAVSCAAAVVAGVETAGAATAIGAGAGVSACSALVGQAANVFIGSQAKDESVDTGRSEQSVLNSLTSTAQQTEQNDVAQALNQLSQVTGPLWTDIDTSLSNVRDGVLKIESASADLQLTQNKATYEAALGTGSDLVMVAGQAVPIPVNTVLNRQSSATEIRYRAALNNAKALAYMARRAIEQRLGVPLSALTQPVGPLDAPASWADSICSLSGIDYTKLSTPIFPDAGGQDSGADQQVIDQFANSFVGDYVTKLSNFVQYFNVQYPSHQGTDTAVLSLRSDLLDPAPTCQALAPNLIFDSGSLDSLVSATVSQQSQGWALSPCDPTTGKCLTVLSGNLLLGTQEGPDGARNNTTAADGGVTFSGVDNGVTWLADTAASSPDAGAPDAGSDATVGDGGDAGAGVATKVQSGLVYQAVNLAPGNYVLSWWDQARDASGNLWASSTPPTPYVARVLDSNGQTVVSFHQAPYVVSMASEGGTPSLWSARQSLTFTVAQQAQYYIAFGASTSADTGLGSVAVADVQLEIARASGGPSAYVETGTSRYVTSFGCARSDSDLRAAFQHVCDDSGTCFYELTEPIIVDTQALNAGTSSLSGKLAKGNYNFRHVNLAINLVGTGVRDCSTNPTPDCFGTGYIEYTLEHDGTNAGIVDWNGNTRYFDFGIADVQHGKALAAERYITMPLGSADQGLITQAGIQHIEFQGRPLDGVYRLRIYDTPALHWSQLQDVQLILNYEYWSEIIANGNASGM